MLSALLVGVSSCNEYLDEPPKDLLSANGFYQTSAQANQGVLGVYSDLRYLSDYHFFELSEVKSDNIWVEPQPNGQRDYSDIGTFRAGSELGTFENSWNAWYKVIYDANTALEKIPATVFDNDEIRNQFLNEAHFLRGWAYFELVRTFGNVPVVLQPSSPSAINSIKQTAPRDVIEQVVIPDLEQALNLPDKGKLVDGTGISVNSEGRADKTAAQAMLARVYMTLAGYPFKDESAIEKAETYLDKVLAKKADYWAPTIQEWRCQWLPSASYYNKYSIFAIQYRDGGYGNPAVFNQISSTGFPASYTTIRVFGNSLWLEKTLLHEYEKYNDLRGDGYTFLNGYEGEGNVQTYTNITQNLNDGSAEANQQVYIHSMLYKYLPTKTKLAACGVSYDESAMLDYNDWPVNFPVLRIEDMMLLKAEILVKKGNIDDALQLVNEIRDRAGVPEVSASDAATAMNYVKRERRLELAGEGVRWFDEVRYGTWQNDITSMIDRYYNPTGTDKALVKEGRYLCPIPQNQMSVTPGLYSQNPDY